MLTIAQPRHCVATFCATSANPRVRTARLLLAAAMLSLALPAIAQVAVTDAWVRGTVTGQKGTGAFMQLTSPTDTALVAVSSPAAKIAEIHEMKLEGGIMRMSALNKLALPAGKDIELKPGGYHVMLMDLAKPLKEGDAVPLQLTFEDKTGRKTTQDVSARVRPLAGSRGAPAPKH